MEKNPKDWQKNWDRVIYDVGNSLAGKTVKVEFTLKNKNLKIIAQKASCSCTVARLGEDKVTASFTPAKNNNKQYNTSKNITVTLLDTVSNTKQLNILRITGTIYKNESDIPS